jgi:hypothetical protein
VPAQFSPRVHVGSVFIQIVSFGQGAILKPHGCCARIWEAEMAMRKRA